MAHAGIISVVVYAFVGFGFDVAASGAGGCACSSRGGDAEYDVAYKGHLPGFTGTAKFFTRKWKSRHHR
jgi:hypothetical protein